MKMRLDKMLSNTGYGSRTEIKKYLKEGRVKVNGQIIKDGKYQIDTDKDTVQYLEEIVEYKEFIYIMMNKPQNVISATEDNYHKTVIDLLDKKYQNFNPFPVGRLDIDTEGLLLLTNDGKLAHSLLSPKRHIDKTYYVEVNGILENENIEKVEKGIYINDGDYTTLPGKLKIITSGEISSALITIQEGKFHQIKKMMQAMDRKVTYLKRISMGELVLDEKLKLGEYRELTEKERNTILERKK